MLSLIAQGTRTAQRCKWSLPPGDKLVLGRAHDCDLPVPWDPHVARNHVEITPTESHLSVSRHPDSSRVIFFQGEPQDQFECAAGEHFVIGLTTILVQEAQVDNTSVLEAPAETVTFDQRELQRVAYTDADRRIEVLTQLPELIRETRNASQMNQRLLNLLLAGVSGADAVALVVLDGEQTAVPHWLRRREAGGRLLPSQRLVREAIEIRRQTVLHIWEPVSDQEGYTQAAGFDWAYCTPVSLEQHKRAGIYVAGRLEQDGVSAILDRQAQLKADVRFTEFVAEIVSTVLRENQWERHKAVLQQFLPGPVLDALGEDLETELLEPRECEVTVLFCDLRGFSRTAEESAGQLMQLLKRVQAALTIMTREILKHGGVTGDFLGDAILGFWGWPFATEDAPLNACRAALAIRRAFRTLNSDGSHSLSDFQVGIGIAHGAAVAGKIGAGAQVKATVFGPVVNLASRLEGMTKQLRVPVLLDQETARLVRPRLSSEEGRLRKLARVLPYGMETPVDVSELLLNAREHPELNDELVATYERGVDEFIAGNWEAAYRCFHQMPASDRAQDFLSVQIAQHNRVSPPGWDGVIRLPSK